MCAHLKSVKSSVVLDSENVIVDGKDVTMRGDEMSVVKRLARVLNAIDLLHYPLDDVSTGTHARYLRHEVLHRPNGHAAHLVLHLLQNCFHSLVHELRRRFVYAHLLARFFQDYFQITITIRLFIHRYIIYHHITNIRFIFYSIILFSRSLS